VTQLGAGVFAFVCDCVVWWGEESGDWVAEEVFEEPRGGRAEGAGGVAAGEWLKVAQAQRAEFVMVAGEGFGVVDELFVGHVSLADAVFEQGARSRLN
jgi:hypothetical protein